MTPKQKQIKQGLVNATERIENLHRLKILYFAEAANLTHIVGTIGFLLIHDLIQDISLYDKAIDCYLFQAGKTTSPD